MKKRKIDPAKEAEKQRKDAERMQQMGEATANWGPLQQDENPSTPATGKRGVTKS
jgi:hypothetical protein